MQTNDKKENQRVRLTKALLKEALLRIMAKKELSHVSIKELCEEAGINRSTFYQHYGDQYGLLREIEDELLEKVRAQLEKIDSSAESILYIESLLRSFRSEPELCRILFCCNEHSAFHDKCFALILDQFTQRVQLKNREGDGHFVLTFLINGALCLIQQWIGEGYQISCEDLARLIYRLCDNATRGILQFSVPAATNEKKEPSAH